MRGSLAVVGLRRQQRRTAEWNARAERGVTRSSCVALVLVDGETCWYRESEPHTPERRLELRRYAAAFDDGYYTAARIAETLGVRLPNGRSSAAPYADLRDVILNYTNDEILAARVALELAGPARASIWEEAFR